MKCNQCQNDFDGLLDGQLDEPAARAARAHIASCPACATAWRDYEAAWTAFAASPEVEPSSNFVARVMIAIDAVDREEPASPWQIAWPRFMRLAAAGAATAIAVSIASLGVLHDQTSFAKADPRLHHELLTELPVIQNLELLKDLDVIRNLDQLSPPVDMDEIELMLQEILST
jgi:anti-sigma factor RsiW